MQVKAVACQSRRFFVCDDLITVSQIRLKKRHNKRELLFAGGFYCIIYSGFL